MIGRLRRWARGHTGRKRYSPVGQAFHWTVAALVVFQLWWGWRTGRLPVGYDKVEAYQLHVQIGLLILGLTALRMVWRLMVPGPVNDADKPGWRSTAAHVTHYVFYVCLVGLPLSGWAMLSATARAAPVPVAGPLSLPLMPFQSLSTPTLWAIEHWTEQLHFALVLTLVILIPIHAGAALTHHFLHSHDVLTAMLPRLPTWPAAKGRPPRKAGRRSPARSAAG